MSDRHLRTHTLRSSLKQLGKDLHSRQGDSSSHKSTAYTHSRELFQYSNKREHTLVLTRSHIKGKTFLRSERDNDDWKTHLFYGLRFADNQMQSHIYPSSKHTRSLSGSCGCWSQPSYCWATTGHTLNRSPVGWKPHTVL